MAAPAETPSLRRRHLFLPGVRHAVRPIREARGTARVMLWVGAGLTLFFILLAFLP
jgi:hypothetical protein